MGCYHATIETGAKPSAITVEKHWASGWIFGLVAPSTIETAAKCPSGVSRVETQLGFANQLVSLLTFGIYTPMDIRVTCAETAPSGTAHIVPGSASTAAWNAAVMSAAAEAHTLRHPVYLQVMR
jgi:hypothetical protein